MADRAEHRMLLTRYLLGQVSQEERDALEHQYIDDDELFEELIAAENDLIDDYVRGRLNPPPEPEYTRARSVARWAPFDAGFSSRSGKELFEASFLSSPERRERVEFAKSLMAHRSVGINSNLPASKHRSAWEAIMSYLGEAPTGARLALATLLLIALMVVARLATINRGLHKQTAAALAMEARAQRQTQELRRQIAELQDSLAVTSQNSEAPPPAGSVILSMALAPDLARGPGHDQTLLPVFRSVAVVRLFLKMNHSTRSTYSAVLETAEGAQVWRGNSLSNEPNAGGGSTITIQLSPDVLKRDDYVLRLFQVASRRKAEEIGTYSFRVFRVMK